VKYLVDTDWVIDAFANIPTALTPLVRHARDGIAVSVLTFGELYDGAYGSQNPLAEIAGYRQFLSGYTVLTVTDAIMDRFAQLRYDLRRQGQLIPDFDLTIAATALVHNLTLMSRNVRHFNRIPGLVLYRP
jgi:tRNA(fMet)-specific endonuclease VapC